MPSWLAGLLATAVVSSGQDVKRVVTIQTLADKDQNTCLEFSGGKVEWGSYVQIGTCTGSPMQNFLFKDGFIHPAAHMGTCLDAGDKMVAGTQLMAWKCNNLPQQKFGYDGNMKTIYLSASQADASLCVDLADGKLLAGNKVQALACSGLLNQKWNVPPAPPAPPASGHPIRTLVDTSLNWCLQVQGTTPGSPVPTQGPVQVAICTGEFNQNFLFRDGSLHLAEHPQTCVDVGAKMAAGTPLVTAACNNSPGQQFGYDTQQKTIYLSASGTDASLCVDLKGGKPFTGTQSQVWQCSGLENQRWDYTSGNDSDNISI